MEKLNLKQKRILIGKRQIDVYLETGIPTSRLSLIENGLVAPRKRELETLRDYYDDQEGVVCNAAV